MRLRTNENPEQCTLFPKELETDTEYWFDWSSEEIRSIQKAMLKQALAELRDKRKSHQMRVEAWNWLMSDEDHPFCSRVCAESNALNIDILRGHVRRLVKDI